MSEYLRVARFYGVVLLIFAVGRWVMGARGIPYDKGHHVFSIVILTALAVIFHGAFCRRWRGYTVLQAAALGATLGLMSQVVIVAATALAYAIGADNSYFVNPRALNTEVPIGFVEAMGRRAGGLVVNTLMSAILGALGWFLGATLPEADRRS